MSNRRVLFILTLSGVFIFRAQSWRQQQDFVSDFCAQASARTSLMLTGEVVSFESVLDPIEIRQIKWQGKTLPIKLFLPVEETPPKILRPNFGFQVQVSGLFRCFIPIQNLAESQEIFWRWEPRVVRPLPGGFRVEPTDFEVSFVESIARKARQWLLVGTENTPALKGFLIAVWTGESRNLPKALITLYRESGILQLLALSGQHVAAAILLLKWGLGWILFHRSNGMFRRWGVVVLGSMPLLAALLLWVLSRQLPSMDRTLAMIVAASLLRLRGFYVNPTRVWCVSMGILLFLAPATVSSAGFVLSALATFFMIQLFSETNPNLRGGKFAYYVWLSLWMPVLLWPFQAWYFYRLSLSACLMTLIQGWIWDLILLPAGFVIPLLLHVPVLSEKVATGCEVVLWGFIRGSLILGEKLGIKQSLSVRPSFWEALAWGVVLLLLVRFLESRFWAKT